MKRILLFASTSLILMSLPLSAAWILPEQINTLTAGLQATRDTDTPRAMAVDYGDSIYMVFETQSDPGNDLGIHFRKRNAIGVWGEEISITSDEPIRDDGYYNHKSFGHPSIIFNQGLEGIICYMMDNGDHSCQTREVRSRDIDFGETYPWGTFRFVSQEGYPYLVSGPGGAIKVPVIAMDLSGDFYSFWPYKDTNLNPNKIQLYWRKYSFQNGWFGSEEIVPAINWPLHDLKSVDAIADPAGDIHLVISMTCQPTDASTEVYHCLYDVTEQEWSDLEPVSAPLGPDGYNSNLPYMAFSGGPSDYVMHVVWEEYLGLGKQVMYRSFNKYTETWDSQVIVKSAFAEKPTVAVLPYGDVYVAYSDSIGGQKSLYYKFKSHNTGNWSDSSRIDLSENHTRQGLPFMISDSWGNLHITYSATVNPVDDNEIFYSKNDLPPLAPINLQALPDTLHPKFKWSPCTEPSFDHYVVCKSQNSKGPWGYEAQTTDTIYTDESVTLNPNNKKIMYYCVKTVDELAQESPLSLALGFHFIYDWGGKIAGELLPGEYLTIGNYPNPFNGQTIIKYNLPQASDIKLQIYDILGREIESFGKPNQPAGVGQITWDASGEPSGVYFYRLSAGIDQKTGRMVLMK
jgi:hypothetical protein